MANQQLKDYISQQLEKGTGKEAITSALLGVGWPQADVQEAMESLIPSAAPAQKAAPVAAAVSSVGDIRPAASPIVEKPSSATSPTVSKIDQMPTAAPESIVPDASAKPAAMQNIAVTKVTMGASRLWMILAVVFAVVAVVGIAGSVYYRMQKTGLDAKVAQMNADISSKPSETALNEVKAALTVAQNKLSETNQVMMAQKNELSLWVVGSSAPTQPIASVLIGIVGGGVGKPYTITTEIGTVATVKNSADPQVAAKLKTYVGQKATIPVTHLPGSREVTVDSNFDAKAELNTMTPEAGVAAPMVQ